MISTSKKRLGIIGGIVFLLLIAFTVFYYQKKSSEKIVLEFGMFAGSNWDVANANSYIIIDKAIERFEAEHENVEIRYTSGILKDDYSEWLSQKTLKGEAPDVFMVLSDDFNQFASVGILKDLEFLIENDPSFDRQAYYETTLSTGIYGDTQYSLPYETVPTLMFVNSSLLRKYSFEVPDIDWTWDDFKNISEKVTADTNDDKILDQFGTYNYDWTSAVYSNGGILFDSDGTKGYFNDSKVTDAIRFTQSIYELNKGQRVTQEDFDDGNVAFMPLSFSEYRTYKSYPYKIKKYTTFQWDCIPMPAGEDGSNTSEVKTLLMGINSKTDHEMMAWEFLKLLTYDEEIQMDIFRYSQGASVLKSVTNSDEAAEVLRRDMGESAMVVDKDVLHQVIENGYTPPKFQKYNESMALAESEITKIIENNQNVDSSLKIFQRSINKFLKQ